MSDTVKTVFVGNLSFKTRWYTLKDFFKQIGNVMYAEVFTDKQTGRSKGVGIVEFETVEEAEKAVLDLNGATLDDRKIYVQLDVKTKRPTEFVSPTTPATPTSFPSSSILSTKSVFLQKSILVTGLNVETEQIMEVSVVATDSNLTILGHLDTLILHVEKSVLDKMNDWCKSHHGASGLTKSCLESTLTLQDAENQIFEFVSKFADKGTAPLAGNSVHMDRLFLRKYMPKVNEYLHYRIVDVSTLKELVFRWYPSLKPFAKKEKHRALDDILESIQELKYYKQHCFK